MRSTPTPTCTSSPAPTRWRRSCPGRTGRSCSRSPSSSGSAGPATSWTASTSRRRMKELPADALTLVEVPALAISSTDCRKRAEETGRSGTWCPTASCSTCPSVGSTGRTRLATQESTDVTASDEAVQMATVAAQAAAAKLADDVVVIDVSGQLVITDCFVIASASNERQVNAIVDEVEEKMRVGGLQAGPPRGRPRGSLGAARLRRHRRAHPAPGRAQLLRPRPAVAGLPGRAGRSGRRRR